jgi:uncharacterized protein (DUF1501 family)
MTRADPPASPSRRQALTGAVGLGIAVEFLGFRAWADSEPLSAMKKLVVIICRGGLDGLSLSPPVGDPNYAALRGPIALAPFGQAVGALRLDDTFGLHPSLAATHALALKGEARIAPAVATPDRERSHFEAQDVLEGGGGVVYGTASGWLNRALEAMGPAGKVKAMSMGPTAPLILRGRIEPVSWSPGGGLGGALGGDGRLPAILHDLYAGDRLLGPALAAGLSAQAMAKVAVAEAASMNVAPAMGDGAGGSQSGPRPGAPQARTLGVTLAGFMTQPGGAQVAAVVMDDFDTHANQGAARGRLALRLTYVDAFLDGLAAGLGPAWGDTVVVMATEFGRTARVNGTGGTDHGTASTALLLGGALKKGGIVGDWPTLAQARLFENRDTAPTLDMRGLFKGVLADHLGVERAKLDTLVFPGSAAVAPTAGVVA